VTVQGRTGEGSHSVSVEGVRLRFAAAHMATFLGECEPLHGHNYVVHVEASGTLTEESWVWDFGRLKRLAREVCEELDHKFLLQRESRILAIKELEDAWEVAFGERRYRFPKSDVYALAADNSTAERIAEHFARRLDAGLAGQGADNVTRLRIGIEEMPGQTGWYMIERVGATSGPPPD
jgi:6-pyruvoyltetrahydropterin/6-carboxytetrahydropterin synthase